MDQFRAKVDYLKTKDEFRRISKKYPGGYKKLVEKKANGEALESDLQDEIPGIELVEPGGGDKAARLRAVAKFFRNGQVYLPHPSIAPWVVDYVKELLKMPNSAHDDQADQTSQALRFWDESGALKQVKAWKW